MKLNKKLITLLLSFFIIIATTYATWQAGGGVKWIAMNEVEQKADRFESHTTDTLDGVTGYYIDTYIGLKWQAYDSNKSGYGAANGTGSGSLTWATDNSYTEPIWNGVSYTYPAGKISSDYPAFEYCENLGTGGWRLPTKRELFSIMTDVKPSGMSHYTALKSIDYIYYWSSTHSAGYATKAWLGFFNDDYIFNATKTASSYVLCIHD